MSNYVDDYLRLRCAADVTRVVFPVEAAARQVSGAMALRRRIKDLVLSDPDQAWWVVDPCAGSGLTAALVAFTLPQVQVLAMDREIPDRPWERIVRFEFARGGVDAAASKLKALAASQVSVILAATGPGRDRAHQVVDLFIREGVEHLVMMPGREGSGGTVPAFLEGRISRYEAWCWHLASRVGGRVQVDARCVGERNAVVTASKPLAGRFVALDDPMHLRVSGLYEAARSVTGHEGLQQAVGQVAELLRAG